jgi:hypothetical protein
MNKQTQEALKMANQALESDNDCECGQSRFHVGKLTEALENLIEIVEALEQPAQEPVAWMSKMGSFTAIAETKKQLPKGTEPIPLYTHPHQWQGLTAEEIELFIFEHTKFNVNKKDDFETIKYFKNCINAIEQALKEKNHG